MKRPVFWGVNAKPGKKLAIALALIPFVVLVGIYTFFSHQRLKESPSDKLLPSVSKMIESTKRMVLEEDKRTGECLMLLDTTSSLKRLLFGVGGAVFFGLVFGMVMGVFPGIRAVFYPSVSFLSIVPPLAILPILFIAFGVDELGKIVLIFAGTFFMIALNVCLSIENSIPRQQIVKAFTLGATNFRLIFRIVLPQIMPCLIDSTRIALGPAWLFLIAAEAISATSGLGYRIFLVRRYLAMDVIIPYVIWITILGFVMSWLLKKMIEWKYPWYLEFK